MKAESAVFNPAEFNWLGLQLTAAAAAHIHKLMSKRPEMLGLRLTIKESGCAGFGYVLDTVTTVQQGDLVYETDGARLYVPLQAMPFIDGTVVDFVRDGLNQMFKFNNPKAQHECGCGESFGV